MTHDTKEAIAAIDVGYGQVKAVISNRPLSQNLDTRTICFPRVIASHQGKKWESLRSASVYSLTSKDEDGYIIGEDARALRQHILSDQSKDYIGKPTYWLALGKAFVDMGAFNGAGFAHNNKLVLKKAVLGLAPGHHTNEIETLMRETLSKGVNFTVNGERYSIQAEEVFLLPQGSGPYFEHLLTDDGKTKNNGNSRISDRLFGIIDIGYETIDYVVFEQKQYVPPKESPSEPNGIRYILEKLLDHVKAKYDYKDDKSESLKEVLYGNPFTWRGEEHDLTAVVEKIVRQHIDKNITPNITQRWQSFIGQMYKIFICGGGAEVIKKYAPDFLNEYKNQLVFCENPELTNVVGFHRYALLKDFIATQEQLKS